MAVKIVRQPNRLALIGAPTSAAAFQAGSEKAPGALRAAGITEKLQALGYEVTDLGDCAERLFADDEEHKRARNLPQIVAGLNDLKPRAELGAKSGGLMLVLGGDCTQIIAMLSGARRYYRTVSLLWMDRHADLNTPASTPSGRLDGMALAAIVGRGSPELVRFWGEPPLVREPEVMIYGLVELDPAEQEYLGSAPLRSMTAEQIRSKGAAKAAQDAMTQLHAEAREFMVHVDLDVINQEEFGATNVPGSGGLSFEDVKESLQVFARQKNLLGLDISQYNPARDADGSAAKKILELVEAMLTARLEALRAPAAAAVSEEPPAAE